MHVISWRENNFLLIIYRISLWYLCHFFCDIYTLFYYRIVKYHADKWRNYLVDSCITGTVLRDTRYFQTLRKYDGSITTIIGDDSRIIGTGRATIVLPNGTRLVINEALLYFNSTRKLLSFKDIRANGFHVETNDDKGEEVSL